MKIKCDFCKTEYSLDKQPITPVQCAVCGHTWTVQHSSNKNAWLVFLASVCALLAAIVFTVVVILHHNSTHPDMNKPLVASVSNVRTVTDAAGVSHFVVSGNVINQSDEIYGVPDLIIVTYDDGGNVISRQKFMPSATLLDSGASVPFTHTLSAPTTGVKKIAAELQDIGGARD